MAIEPENTPRPRRRGLSGSELSAKMAEIEKGQQLAGHFPDAETMERTRQILTGEVSYDEAMAAWRREYTPSTKHAGAQGD